MTSNFFEVQGLGPIDLFRVEFPDDDAGGTTVIRGRNEAGKSTALEAIDALITGNATGLDPSNDGPGVGYVRGPGRELKITARAARKKAGEEADQVRALPSGDLATFMSPGYESEDSNDRARIRELAKIAGTQLVLEDFAKAAQSDEWRKHIKPEQATATDPVTLAARVKAAFEVCARGEEAEAERTSGRVAEIEATAQGIDLSVETRAEILDGDLRARVRELAAAEAQRDHRQLAIRRRTDAIARLEEFRSASSAPGADAAGRDLAAAEAAIRDRNDEYEVARARVDQVKSALREAEASFERASARLAAARQDKQAAERVLAVAAQAAAAVAGWREVADAPLPEAPDDAALAALQAAERAAMDSQALGTEAARAKERLEQAAALRAQRDLALARAHGWRDAAASVDDVLTGLVRSIGIEGLKVSQGRLLAKNRAGWLPIDKLSGAAAAEVTARIWFRAAAKMRVPGAPVPKVLLRQEAWDGMLAAARNRLIKLSKEEGVRLVAAEAWPSKLEAVELQEAHDAR